MLLIRLLLTSLVLGMVLTSVMAQERLAQVEATQDGRANEGNRYEWRRDIPYRVGEGLSEYADERCRLDLYYPRDANSFSTVVWFHGGGLTGGQKEVPFGLREKGLAIVAVNYRLSPKVKASVCIDDAAAAVAWTFNNIQEYGGRADRIFVSGHSAGGYLTSMVGLDKRWLHRHGVSANDIAGLVPFSGHAITHFTVRAERGIDRSQPIVDDLAPLFHVRNDAPPILLITGDREKELLGRYEETAYLWRMLQEVGHPHAELVELKGYGHGGMAEAAQPSLVKFVRSVR